MGINCGLLVQYVAHLSNPDSNAFKLSYSIKSLWEGCLFIIWNGSYCLSLLCTLLVYKLNLVEGEVLPTVLCALQISLSVVWDFLRLILAVMSDLMELFLLFEFVFGLGSVATHPRPVLVNPFIISRCF